jgi:hypothetical protein
VRERMQLSKKHKVCKKKIERCINLEKKEKQRNAHITWVWRDLIKKKEKAKSHEPTEFLVLPPKMKNIPPPFHFL